MKFYYNLWLLPVFHHYKNLFFVLFFIIEVLHICYFKKRMKNMEKLKLPSYPILTLLVV